MLAVDHRGHRVVTVRLVESVEVPQECVHVLVPGDLAPREVLVDFPLAALPVLGPEPRLGGGDGDEGANLDDAVLPFGNAALQQLDRP